MKNWNWGGISVVFGLAVASIEIPWLLVPIGLCIAWGCGVFNRGVKK